MQRLTKENDGNSIDEREYLFRSVGFSDGLFACFFLFRQKVEKLAGIFLSGKS